MQNAEALVLPPGTHPLQQRFPPMLLSRYPDQNDTAGGQFPPFVPMFSFPNDILIQAADERPKSTWHGFSMTRGDGQPLFGLCLVMYVPVDKKASRRIETCCLQWRTRHMSPENRQQSAAYRTQLAAERSNLSSLLTKLSTSDSDDRNELYRRIEECEGRITQYSELLRPMRHSIALEAAAFAEGASIWIPRAFGILGRDPYQQHTWKSWLLAVCSSYVRDSLLNVSPHNKFDPILPLPRYVINLCGEVPNPPRGKLVVELSVRNCRIRAVSEPPNELPGSRTIDLYPLFRALSLSNVVTLFEAALLECRIIFISEHTAMLSAAANALINLIYPLQWNGLYVPVLPRRLISTLDAPVPYIMGIETAYDGIEPPEGNDVVIVELDANYVDHRLVQRLPSETRRKLIRLLLLAAPLHSPRFKVPFGSPLYCRESYPGGSVLLTSSSSTDLGCSNLADLMTKSSSFFAKPYEGDVKVPNLNAFLTSRFSQFDRPAGLVVKKSWTTATQESPDKFKAGLEHSFDKHTNRLAKDPKNPRRSLEAGGRSISAYGAQTTPSVAGSSIMTGIDDQMHGLGTNDTSLLLREGHQLEYKERPESGALPVCDYTMDVIIGEYYHCIVCGLIIDLRYLDTGISLPCLPTTFDADKVRAAFVRVHASLLDGYRQYLKPSPPNTDSIFVYDRSSHIRDIESSRNQFMREIVDTQAFASFIDDRCTKAVTDPEIMLFDHILLARHNRSKKSLFSKTSVPYFLTDRSNQHTKRFAGLKPSATDIQEHLTPDIPEILEKRWMHQPRITRPKS